MDLNDQNGADQAGKIGWAEKLFSHDGIFQGSARKLSDIL